MPNVFAVLLRTVRPPLMHCIPFATLQLALHEQSPGRRLIDFLWTQRAAGALLPRFPVLRIALVAHFTPISRRHKLHQDALMSGFGLVAAGHGVVSPGNQVWSVFLSSLKAGSWQPSSRTEAANSRNRADESTFPL